MFVFSSKLNTSAFQFHYVLGFGLKKKNRDLNKLHHNLNKLASVAVNLSSSLSFLLKWNYFEMSLLELYLKVFKKPKCGKLKNSSVWLT